MSVGMLYRERYHRKVMYAVSSIKQGLYPPEKPLAEAAGFGAIIAGKNAVGHVFNPHKKSLIILAHTASLPIFLQESKHSPASSDFGIFPL